MRDWRQWWKAAAVRAVKTVAQTAVATIGTSAILADVNWPVVASASVLAGLLSLLTSVAGIPEVNGAPGGTQQSGPAGERTSSGTNEPSPQGEDE